MHVIVVSVFYGLVRSWMRLRDNSRVAVKFGVIELIPEAVRGHNFQSTDSSEISYFQKLPLLSLLNHNRYIEYGKHSIQDCNPIKPLPHNPTTIRSTNENIEKGLTGTAQTTKLLEICHPKNIFHLVTYKVQLYHNKTVSASLHDRLSWVRTKTKVWRCRRCGAGPLLHIAALLENCHRL
jgi:hypothetical protein